MYSHNFMFLISLFAGLACIFFPNWALRDSGYREARLRHRILVAVYGIEGLACALACIPKYLQVCLHMPISETVEHLAALPGMVLVATLGIEHILKRVGKL